MDGVGRSRRGVAARQGAVAQFPVVLVERRHRRRAPRQVPRPPPFMRDAALRPGRVSIENIQDVLGHMSPTITKTIYVEATRRVQRDAVDRLGFLFDE